MKRFLLFTVAFFALGLSFSAQAQFSMGETTGDTSLPVTLSSFTARAEAETVKLLWRTESEVNNVGFTVYRSEAEDGKYTKVTFLNGAGTTGMPTDYQLADTKVEQGKTYFYYIEDIDITGKRNKSQVIKVSVPVIPIPKQFALLQNYPNPFNPETWIPYQLPDDVAVSIFIYNIQGRLVRRLELGEQSAGSYMTRDKAVYWDGKDDRGEKVASGIYWYTLRAGDFDAMRRMVIVK